MENRRNAMRSGRRAFCRALGVGCWVLGVGCSGIGFSPSLLLPFSPSAFPWPLAPISCSSPTPNAQHPTPLIIPQPHSLKGGTGNFAINAATRILTDAPDSQAVQDLNDALATRLLLRLPVTRLGPAPNFNNVIVVVTAGSPLAASFTPKQAKPDSRLGINHAEGYSLQITLQRSVLVGHDAAGTFYGAQTLLQLIEALPAPMKANLSALTVEDWPDFPVRAMHVCLFRYSDRRPSLPYLKTWLGRVAPCAKLNTVIIQVDDLMRYPSHPEMSRPGALTQDEMRGLVAYGQRRHLNLIPHLQCLSHQDSVLGYGHPEMLLRPDSGTYNPMAPGALALLTDLMRDLLQVFGAKQIHLGMDEVDMDALKANSLTAALSPAELYLAHLLALRAAAKQFGATVLIWPDMIPRLDPDGQAHLLARIPRDVILCDWQYDAKADFPSLDRYVQAGFEVWATGTAKYHATNLPNLAAAAKRRNVRGLVGSTWNSFGSLDNPLEGRSVSSLLLAGEYGWNAPPAAVTQARYDPLPLLKALSGGTSSEGMPAPSSSKGTN